MSNEELRKRLTNRQIGQLKGEIPPAGYLTIDEAAFKCRVWGKQLGHLVKENRTIPSIKVGNLRFVHPDEIEAWIRKNPKRALRLLGRVA